MGMIDLLDNAASDLDLAREALERVEANHWWFVEHPVGVQGIHSKLIAWDDANRAIRQGIADGFAALSNLAAMLDA
jgi:hypothetical protein